MTKEHHLLSGVIDPSGRVVIQKPFPQELSSALFGTPSVEQFRRLQGLRFGERLVPRHDAAGPSWAGPDGRTVVPATPLAMLGLFSEGRAPVQARSGSPRGVSWGYADPAGRLAIPAIHAAACPFSEGLGLVRDVAGRWGWAASRSTRLRSREVEFLRRKRLSGNPPGLPVRLILRRFASHRGRSPR